MALFRSRRAIVWSHRAIVAARELRDRWLEQVNQAGAGEFVAIAGGKYDVSRRPMISREANQTPLLPAAA